MNGTSKRTLIVVAAVALLGTACAKKKVASTTPASPSVPVASVARIPKQAQQPLRASKAPSPAVTTPASSYPSASTRARIDQLLAKIEDAYFDYNNAALRPDAMKALQSDSTELRDILKDFPSYKLTIEGHCDERGSAEYNLALGAKRADAAKSYLVQIGIPSMQLDVVSLGKERQVCEAHDEACWQRNRRIHVVAMAKN